MFTIGAIVLAVLLAFFAGRANDKDRQSYDSTPTDLQNWLLNLHIRQDLKLISFLLMGVIVMLGVVADRIR